MTRTRRLVAAAAALCAAVALLGAGPAPSARADDTAAPPGDAAPAVLHRVVWDAAQRGGPATLIMSAERNGSDRVEIFRAMRGFVLDLTLDRAGRRVAIAPFVARRSRARLIVADVLGDGSYDVLADARKFWSVGGIGWSPDGTALAFEGSIIRDGDVHEYLWTIGADGTGLERLAPLPEDEVDGLVTISNQLAWTDAGIHFLGPDGLMLLEGGEVTLVVPNAGDLQISGNGRWLFYTRGRYSALWRMHPDGTGATRLIRRTRPAPGLGYLKPMVPDHTGRRLLTHVSGTDGVRDGVVLHPVDRAPTVDDWWPRYLRGAWTVTWN